MNPDYGQRLLQWLPAHWRERDGSGDLRRLLAVYGELLDALHATVAQRRNDSFPDQDAAGAHCQPWLLPYFAQLLDVDLAAPDEAGRRAELTQAIAWRQRKGTLGTAEAIAEAVGGSEVEIQEGWKRVAITPRVDRALLPEAAYGEAALPVPASAAMRARHPGLPAVTPDLRFASRAVQCAPANSGAHATTFGGELLHWRQAARHGVPCFADSFQDVSRRTPDLRTPGAGRGLHHPRRLLLHAPPPAGFFVPGQRSRHWSDVVAMIQDARTEWTERAEPARRHDDDVAVEVRATDWNGAPVPLVCVRALSTAPLRLFGRVTLGDDADAAPTVYQFEHLWLDHFVQINRGAARLLDCAVRHLRVTTAQRQTPVLSARACLFKILEAARGLVRLEYATVLEALLAEHLQASDCIVMAALRKDTVDDDVPAAGCVRYSRVPYIPLPPDPDDPGAPNDPHWIAQWQRSALICSSANCSTVTPLFWHDDFGRPGCATLHPDCDPAIAAGAEDGGELGAFHDQRHVLRRRAVLDKLQRYLPLGMEAQLLADPSLNHAPPKARS